ncbi:MAG: hypothetical protein E7Z91_02690 [Cyanobacteria bacterium SIG30]|nr:hypothetical protein [Cyanobacteria bacterium SIG30]
MQIQSTNLGFKGSVARQAYYQPNPKTGVTGYEERSFEEMIKSYDDAIEAIKQKKKMAIELDKFMREDNEVQKLIKQLPKNEYISVNNFIEPDNYQKFTLKPLKLDTMGWDQDGFRLEKRALNENGEIDKEGILKWLQKTISYYGTGE